MTRGEAIDIAIKSLEAWETVFEEIDRYEADCTLGEDDPTCLKCTKNVFDSIRSIINKQIAEEEK